MWKPLLSFSVAAIVTATAQADMAPLPSSEQVITRIAFGSCADEELPQPIWAQIKTDNPELFLFIGDNVYADRNRGEPVTNYSRSELEYSYRLLQSHADFAPFQASTPILATWDDHDFGKNDAGVEFELKSDAKELMIETFGVPQDADMVQRPGVYHSAIFGPEGQRVQIIMLDTRWFRSSLKETDEHGVVGKERYLPDDDPNKTMLGAAQWQWLEKELNKPADLRLLVSSIQIVADGHGWEAWRTMPREREKLYSLLAETGAGENTIILSGDRHVGGLYQQQASEGLQLVEITASSLNLPWSNWNPGKTEVPETGPHQVGKLYGFENYGMLTVDWSTREVSMDLKSKDGAVVRSIDVAF